MLIIFLGVLFSDLVQFCRQTAGERARRIAAGETNRFFWQLLEAALHKQRPNLEDKLFYSNQCLIRRDDMKLRFDEFFPLEVKLNVVNERKNQQSNKRTGYSPKRRVYSCDFVDKTLLFLQDIFFL